MIVAFLKDNTFFKVSKVLTFEYDSKISIIAIILKKKEFIVFPLITGKFDGKKPKSKRLNSLKYLKFLNYF